jgi:hypothetical protein
MVPIKPYCGRLVGSQATGVRVGRLSNRMEASGSHRIMFAYNGSRQ